MWKSRKLMCLAGIATVLLFTVANVAYAEEVPLSPPIFPVPTLSVSTSETGYYLPKGYKVVAEITVPPAPFWPGIAVGDAVGIKSGTEEYVVVGFGYKASILEGFWACHGVQVQKCSGSSRELLVMITNEDNPDFEAGTHKVTIVYGYDGIVKISVDSEFLRSFPATADKYAITAKGAKVYPPEQIASGSGDDGKGEGYTPPTIREIQLQYLALGAGAGAVAIVALLLALKGRRNAAALLLLLALCTGSLAAAATASADELAYVVVNPDGTYSIEGYVELSSSWDFGALKIVRAIYYPDSDKVELHFYWYGDSIYPYLGIGHSNGDSGYLLESGIPPSTRLYKKVYELSRSVDSYPYIDFYMAMNPSYGGPQIGKVAIADFEKVTTTPSPTTTTTSAVTTTTASEPASTASYSVSTANTTALAAGAGVAAIGALAALALAKKR